VALAIAVVTSFVSGLYPAFYLSKQNPVKNFRKPIIQSNSFSVRKILVTTQYIISSSLIVSVCVVYQQVHYMQTRDLGFNKEQLMVIPIRGNMNITEKLTLKNELLQNNAIGNVSLANYVPGQEAYENQDIFLPEGHSLNEPVPLWYINSDFDFANTMQLKVISGRLFSHSFSTDSASYVINETAAKQLGWNARSAIGKKIYSFDDANKKNGKTIIGVVNDFQFENFTTPVRPMLVGIDPHYWWKYIIRINAKDANSTIEFIKAKWKNFQPSYPFEYSFVDQSYAAFWKKETIIAKFSTALTTVAIIIASLGLLALSLFMALQRRKEISIRKIVGASVVEIVALLSRDILKLIFLAFCIAAPLAWFAMNQWLQDFSYRIQISWWVFIFAAIVSIALALLTIIFQSVKAALANPVKSLKIE
jgi:putative ABC transport system permease protein